MAPVWFVLDGDDIVFMTGADTVKGRNLARDARASFSVDEPAPPYAFVTISGRVELSEDLEEMYRWALPISGRYMGEELAESFARRNAVAGGAVGAAASRAHARRRRHLRLRPDRPSRGAARLRQTDDMQTMTDERRRAFLLEGTRTGHLATTRADGSAHVAPVCFLLDGDRRPLHDGSELCQGS